MDDELKGDLTRHLALGRDALLWKLDGLSEYDVRRPVVPTGTNLLGLVKHLACVEASYFGAVFGRPFGEPLPWWDDDAEPNSDMWATAQESRGDIVGLYRRACVHADATIAALDLDTVGVVPWWTSGGRITLHRMLVVVIAETHRHAGHADIVRELVDGQAGFMPDNGNLPPWLQDTWSTHWTRVEAAAREADVHAASKRDPSGE
jgi:hypothetical protein